jgi:hypothetical protein
VGAANTEIELQLWFDPSVFLRALCASVVNFYHGDTEDTKNHGVVKLPRVTYVVLHAMTTHNESLQTPPCSSVHSVPPWLIFYHGDTEDTKNHGEVKLACNLCSISCYDDFW